MLASAFTKEKRLKPLWLWQIREIEVSCRVYLGDPVEEYACGTQQFGVYTADEACTHLGDIRASEEYFTCNELIRAIPYIPVVEKPVTEPTPLSLHVIGTIARAWEIFLGEPEKPRKTKCQQFGVYEKGPEGEDVHMGDVVSTGMWFGEEELNNALCDLSF